MKLKNVDFLLKYVWCDCGCNNRQIKDVIGEKWFSSNNVEHSMSKFLNITKKKSDFNIKAPKQH